MKQARCPQQQRKVRIGSAVEATHGHDQGRIYLVLRQDEVQVVLSDGAYRPFAKTKVKNLKHLRHRADLIEKKQLWEDLDALSPDREKDIYIRRLLKQVTDNKN